MSWFVYNSNGKLLQSLVVSDNAVTNAKMADDAIGVAELSASGTASSSTFLRDDNAWAAPAGGPSQATQSALEAETNEDTYAPPDLIKHSPGVAKVWCRIASAGSLESPDYGVATVDDEGTGQYQVNYTTAFSGDVYSSLAAPCEQGQDRDTRCEQQTATKIDIRVQDISGDTGADGRTSFVVFGDQ